MLAGTHTSHSGILKLQQKQTMKQCYFKTTKLLTVYKQLFVWKYLYSNTKINIHYTKKDKDAKNTILIVLLR